MAHLIFYVDGTNNPGTLHFLTLDAALDYGVANYADLTGRDTTDFTADGGDTIPVALEIQCLHIHDTTPTVQSATFTTDATHQILIHSPAAARHSGVWTEDAYTLTIAGASSALDLRQDYMWVDHLQICHNTATDYVYGIKVSTARSGIRISNNILKRTGSSTRSYGITASVATGSYVRIWNNIVYDFYLGINITAVDSWSGWVCNNTVANCTTGFAAAYHDGTAYNNIDYGCTTAYNSATGWTGDYNRTTTAAAIGGAHDGTSVTFTFVDADNDNYQLAADDAGATNLGTDLHASAVLPFNVDTAGHQRPDGAWDCGAHENTFIAGRGVLRSALAALVMAGTTRLIESVAVTAAAASVVAAGTVGPPPGVTATVAVTAAGATSAGRGYKLQSETTIAVTLTKLHTTSTVSFGVPLARSAAVSQTGQVRVLSGGTVLPIKAKALLWWYDATWTATYLRSVLIQFDAAYMPDDTLDVVVEILSAGSDPDDDVVAFTEVSTAVNRTAWVTEDYTITYTDGVYAVAADEPYDLTVFATREPNVLAQFPEGYLAATKLLGPLLTEAQVEDSLSDYAYLSRNFLRTLKGAFWQEDYPELHDEKHRYIPVAAPHPVFVYNSTEFYEMWLYDRPVTALLGHFYFGTQIWQRIGYQEAWFYSHSIVTSGTNRGLFPTPAWKPMYTKARGMFAYYAMTGDEIAGAALDHAAYMWSNEPYSSVPYQNGSVLGTLITWTERLLGCALEATYLGYCATGTTAYKTAFLALWATAYTHISTSDQATLTAINKDISSPPFPPQNAWVHNSYQHEGGSELNPWCSSWMSEILLPTLLEYYDQGATTQVLDTLVRFGRFMRDTGVTYWRAKHLPMASLEDYFLSPAEDPTNDQVVQIVGVYGSGIRGNLTRYVYCDYYDYLHSLDATALLSAYVWSLTKSNLYNTGGPLTGTGPYALSYATEGAASAGLVDRFHTTVLWSFEYPSGGEWREAQRSPTRYFSQETLATGYLDPYKFFSYKTLNGNDGVHDGPGYGTGWPLMNVVPLRKPSWWFNTSLNGLALLADAWTESSVVAVTAAPPTCAASGTASTSLTVRVLHDGVTAATRTYALTGSYVDYTVTLSEAEEAELEDGDHITVQLEAGGLQRVTYLRGTMPESASTLAITAALQGQNGTVVARGELRFSARVALTGAPAIVAIDAHGPYAAVVAVRGGHPSVAASGTQTVEDWSRVGDMRAGLYILGEMTGGLR